MRAHLDHVALIEDDDLIRVANGRKPVCDRERRPALGEPLERFLHGPLSLRVERRGVASSRTRIGGLRRIVRAIAMRCFSLTGVSDSSRSPTTVSYPSGNDAISPCTCAARAASSISASVASGLAKRRFSRTLASGQVHVSCETTPTVAAIDSNVSSRRRPRRS